MSNQDRPKHTHDPETYAAMCIPQENVEEATKVAEAFMGAFEQLRKNCRIPEVLIEFFIYVKDDKVPEGRICLAGGQGYGNPRQQLRLARRAFDRELGDLLDAMKGMSYVMEGARPEGDAHVEE